MDVDGVTAARLTHAAANALASVIKDLSEWAGTQTAAGFAALSSVLAIAINGTSVKVLCFEACCLPRYTKADLVRRCTGAWTPRAPPRPVTRGAAQGSDYRADAPSAVRSIWAWPHGIGADLAMTITVQAP